MVLVSSIEALLRAHYVTVTRINLRDGAAFEVLFLQACAFDEIQRQAFEPWLPAMFGGVES